MAAWTAPSHWRTRPARDKGEVMRTLRLFLAGTVILVLVGGLGGAVAAQDGEAADPMAPAIFTCTIGAVGIPTSPEGTVVSRR